ncbi:hypothetical protein CCOS01_15606 [Colletotrichum costaricense]|uniref:Uncharacterized protein n=1 Tax=Colletotrichum costaricense TaxID=1209916 RepID=A0AAI9YHD6_9PEZI|nr:hypothetical protein CCOS01_15606 [Colletotrichum costaricense]
MDTPTVSIDPYLYYFIILKGY